MEFLADLGGVIVFGFYLLLLRRLFIWRRWVLNPNNPHWSGKSKAELMTEAGWDNVKYFFHRILSALILFSLGVPFLFALGWLARAGHELFSMTIASAFMIIHIASIGYWVFAYSLLTYWLVNLWRKALARKS